MKEQDIEDIVWQELERAMKIRAQHQWALPYEGLEFIKAKTYYGKATHKGKLQISRIFLGTQERDQLIDTIRHEIAHLMCGMKAGHDANWRHAARLLGCRPRASQPMEGQLKETSKKKWRLIGILESGEEVRFHASHVQQAKYLMPDRTFKCKHGIIVECKYVRNI